MAEGPIIELEHLEVHLAGRVILKDLRASLPGGAIGLLGPNGAGKTTLIHTLMGFFPPSRGTARIFGRDVHAESHAVRALVGFMPESESFIAGMTAVGFVRYTAELARLPSQAALERAHQALFYVGLGKARYRKLEEYSQGMKQLVKLAQAIAHGPRLLFLDEPTNGLDPAARRRMIRLIQGLHRDGRVHLVLSSHLLRDVEECCGQVLILKDGRIVQHCDLEQEWRLNRRFLELEADGDAGALAELAGRLGCDCAPARGRALKLVLPEGVELRDLYRLAAERGLCIRRLNYRRDSLEDIFLKAMENGRGGP